jgi:class 3 adenylate cyclase
MALSRVLSPTMIGREAELSTLEDALLSALRGDGGVVIVGGEAGMGKTRLVNSLANTGRRLGAIVIAGGCSEAELSLPYLPFLEAIGNYIATAQIGPLRERLGPAADELAQLFPQLGRPVISTGDAASAKMRLFESILMLLGDAARKRALLLVLEDLQWADPATRELLDYSTRRLRSTNVLIVATYRTDEMHRRHALLPTIQGWRRSGQVAMVDLQALTAHQVAEMVCAIFDESEISDEFREFLHERSEGNPFVLEEMLRDALDRGDIFRTQTGWDRKPLAEFRIPPTVRDTILQRLERLSPEHVAVLAAASVMGRSFEVGSLAEVARVDEGVALEALEASVTAQLIEPEDRLSARYRFRHALMQEAIYEDLVVPRRQQLHSRTADALKARGGGASIDLASHLFGAGRTAEAVAMCFAAADEAIHTRAYRDAAELLERAGNNINDPVERARTLCRAGDAYWNNSESANAKRLLEEGIAELEAAGLTLEAAGHRVELGRCWWELMRTDLAEQHLEKARAVLEPAGPSEALALAYIRLSGLAMFTSNPAKCLELATLGLKAAEGAGLPRAWALIFVAGGEIGLGRVREGFKHADEAYRASIEGNFRFQAGNAVYNSTWEALHLGRGDMLELWYLRAGSHGYAADGWPRYTRGLVSLQRGEVEVGIEAGLEAGRLSRDAGYQKMVWRTQVLLAQSLAENLRPEEAVAVLPALSTRVDNQDAIYDTAARVRTCLALGDVEGASRVAMTVDPRALSLGSPSDVVSEAVGDAMWLREFLDAMPAQGEVLESPRIAAAHGRLALLEGRIEDALEQLVRADAGFGSAGLMLDRWHLARSLAEGLVRSGHEDEAKRRLQQVMTEATASGAHLAAKLAAAAAARLGLDVGPMVEPPPAATSASVVTGERVVSVLFADVRGYTLLSGETPPADLAERISTLQRWAKQEVERRHGIVDKFAGDAIMATFNVGGQSVDHAAEALRAALSIIDKAALAGLPVGAGVAVGPAVVGSLAESANLSVLGEVTNLASRLQAQAEAGEVLVADEVYRRTRGWLDSQRILAEPVELRLKGFSKPVLAHRVRSEVAAVPAPAPA